jgi:hypothetical protein
MRYSRMIFLYFLLKYDKDSELQTGKK